uniref:Uncharacterized protein n=1 Tax=Kryptolebias marmoratus TaxID=37003 RepID=A0A3Q2ZZG4_KRYMA
DNSCPTPCNSRSIQSISSTAPLFLKSQENPHKMIGNDNFTFQVDNASHHRTKPFLPFKKDIMSMECPKMVNDKTPTCKSDLATAKKTAGAKLMKITVCQ